MEPLGTATADIARIIGRVALAAPFAAYGLMILVAAPAALVGMI